jgi:hypothetical protein
MHFPHQELAEACAIMISGCGWAWCHWLTARHRVLAQKLLLAQRSNLKSLIQQ